MVSLHTSALTVSTFPASHRDLAVPRRATNAPTVESATPEAVIALLLDVDQHDRNGGEIRRGHRRIRATAPAARVLALPPAERQGGLLEHSNFRQARKCPSNHHDQALGGQNEMALE